MNLFKRLKEIHPIVNIAVITLVLKYGLLIHYYVTDSAIGDVASSLTFALGYHLALSGIVFGVLLLIWYQIKVLRNITSLLVLLYTVVSIILCQADLFLVRFTGMRFTPSILRTYGLDYIFHPDVFNTLFANPLLSATVLILVLSVLSLFIFYKKIMLSVKVKSFTGAQLGMATMGFVGFWFCLLIIDSTYYLQARPPEISFAQYTSYNVRMNVGLDDGYIEENNKNLDLIGRVPENGDYPLLHQKTSLEEIDNFPDVILIMIESLRGQELSFVSDTNPVSTPNIDSLLRHSVAFSKFVSNGYPTDDGMFAIHTSIIPHYIKKNVRDNYEVKYKSIPQILSEKGYHNFMYSSVTPFKPMIHWFDQWYDETRYECGGKHCRDNQLFDNTADWLKTYDEDTSAKPLFMYLHTNDTHLPFQVGEIEDPEVRKQYPNLSKTEYNDLHERYRACLEWTDYSMTNFLNYLSVRKRNKNTIVIFVGDHAKEANEEFRSGTRYFPMNPFVLTGALISGPEKFIGTAPRVEDFAASGVDLLPTIVSMLKINTDYASWGNSLVDNSIPLSSRYSISVRPGGMRYNWADSSIYVNSNNPNDYWVTHFLDPLNDKTALKSETYQTKARKVHELIHYGSFLLESNRILP